MSPFLAAQIFLSSSLFGPKHAAAQVNLDKDDELPLTFVSAVKMACNKYAQTLLPQSSSPQSQGRGRARSSRKSVSGWDGQ